MQSLPIVEREMRVAARQPRTWWWRIFAFGLAFVIFCFIGITVSRYSTLSRAGHELFTGLGGFILIFSLLAGPLATADCISRERRDGTLGLLFLTDLRSYDVVLGKMVAASFNMTLALAATLPLVAIPVLMGGVGLGHLALTLLGVLNLLFLSLSIGAWSSTVTVSGRGALGLAALMIGGIALGLPWVADGWFNVDLNRFPGLGIAAVCPSFTIVNCLQWNARADWKYWMNFGGVHLLAWLFLVRACIRTSSSWRVIEVSATRARRGWLEILNRGRTFFRSRLRHLLDINPVYWLDSRDRLPGTVLKLLVIGCLLVWIALHFLSGHRLPDNESVILWPLLSHYILCIWIAIHSPRRMADDKESGALELLLCTPLPPSAIVRGNIRSLVQFFGLPFLGLIILDAFLVVSYRLERGWHNTGDEELAMCLAALITFPIQAWTFARMGIYQGLREVNSLRATFMLIWKSGLLPWAIFFGVLLSWESLRREYPWIPRITEWTGFGTWALAHVISCLFFLELANRKLRTDFRGLAGTRKSRFRWAWRGKPAAQTGAA